MACPAFFRAGYNAGTEELFLAYDIGLAPEKATARLRFCRFTFDRKWGFRAALALVDRCEKPVIDELLRPLRGAVRDYEFPMRMRTSTAPDDARRPPRPWAERGIPVPWSLCYGCFSRAAQTFPSPW